MAKKLLLIYPELGFVGSYVVNIPLSLLHAAARLDGIPNLEVEIMDCRLDRGWRNQLTHKLKNEDIFLVGISVMSGLPVVKAAEISGMVKKHSHAKVVWGGAHPTILPEQTLRSPHVDYCVRGYGSIPLRLLAEHLLGGLAAMPEIPGICYKPPGKTVIGGINDTFENFDFKSLPYPLIEPVLEKYFEQCGERMFPIYTAAGCPYQCAFCISPVWYRDVKKKWVPTDAVAVVDHIEHLVAKYRADAIYFYDDDTFVKIAHFSAIARELLARNIHVKIGVRGIRVNELLKMKPDDFRLLERVGVTTIHIGLESGSQRMLDLMKKGITVEQSLEVNRRLKDYPTLIPMYNLLCGFPTETVDDLKDTGRFMLRLSEENPNCIIFDPGKLVPYPGSELYDLAVAYGFKAPETDADWERLDQEADIEMPWYTPAYNRHIKMLQIASYPISNWERYLEGRSLFIRLFFGIAKALYNPVARYRLRHGNASLFVEETLFNMARKLIT